MREPLKIGDYTLQRDEHERLWIYHSNGEAMQLKEADEIWLLRLVDVFWGLVF